jgi:excisionase family DNA binding protein
MSVRAARVPLQTRRVAMTDDRLQIARDGGGDVREAAQFLGLSRSTVYKLMDAGLLPYAKIAGRRIIPRAAMVRLLAEAITTGRPHEGS